MKATLEQLAKFVDGRIKGDGSMVVKGFCSPQRAQPDCIGFIEHSGDRRLLKGVQPGAVITTSRLARYFKSAIIVDNPRLAFVMVMEHFLGRKTVPRFRSVVLGCGQASAQQSDDAHQVDCHENETQGRSQFVQ